MKPRSSVSLALVTTVAALTWTTVGAQPQPPPAPQPTPDVAPSLEGSGSAAPADGSGGSGSAAVQPPPVESSAAGSAAGSATGSAAGSAESSDDGSGSSADSGSASEDFPTKPELHRNFAGSVQLDYMAVPSRTTGREIALDGATVEVSLKLAMDFSEKISANVKVCFSCHGFEVGMAFFDLRVADQLNFRVGRFTPAFGEFPLRHDPANHRTSDKPLVYDMGRMLRMNDWNEGVLPTPWVDNGIEVNGTHFFGNKLQTDYAAYAIGGPRAGSDPTDFDFVASHTPYYVDNNSRPTYGGQIVATVISGSSSFALGASTMRGTYDPQHHNRFSIFGAHAVARFRDVFIRAEYLSRYTEMSLTNNPAERFKYGPGSDGSYDTSFVKDGGYLEIETPVNRRLTLVFREDTLRRRGNVVASSALRSDSAVLRHTAGLAVLLRASLRLKASYEYYDFSDFEDESVLHLGIAGPF